MTPSPNHYWPARRQCRWASNKGLRWLWWAYVDRVSAIFGCLRLRSSSFVVHAAESGYGLRNEQRNGAQRTNEVIGRRSEWVELATNDVETVRRRELSCSGLVWRWDVGGWGRPRAIRCDDRRVSTTVRAACLDPGLSRWPDAVKPCRESRSAGRVL